MFIDRLKYYAFPLYDTPNEGGTGGSGEGTGGSGEGGVAAALAAKDAAEKAAADAAKAKADDEAAKKAAGEKSVSDDVAKLLKENMKRKAREEELQGELKKFEGIDPEAVRKMLADKAEDEKKKAEAAGEYDRVKKMMADEHAKEVAKLQKALADSQSEISHSKAAINELTVGQAFASSEFIKEDLILPPAKARALFASNFEMVDGKIVAFDKPKGASERTQLVDASGAPLGFDEAMKKIVAADPDSASLLKSKLRAGAGSSTTDTRSNAQPSDKLFGAERIKAALVKSGKK